MAHQYIYWKKKCPPGHRADIFFNNLFICQTYLTYHISFKTVSLWGGKKIMIAIIIIFLKAMIITFGWMDLPNNEFPSVQPTLQFIFSGQFWRIVFFWWISLLSLHVIDINFRAKQNNQQTARIRLSLLFSRKCVRSF